jgi:heme/copper-type cytochrome/quinol oxidase subunit 2
MFRPEFEYRLSIQTRSRGASCDHANSSRRSFVVNALWWLLVIVLVIVVVTVAVLMVRRARRAGSVLAARASDRGAR